MGTSMDEAVIVSAVRTPVGKAPRGALSGARPEDLGAAVFAEALARAPGVAPDEIDDVVVGCAFPEAEQGLDVGRAIALRAGLPVSVPALTVNRFCASGLQSLCQAADRVRTGGARAVLAGGVECMSRVPMTGNVFRPDPVLAVERPAVYMGMGLTAEQVARRFDVSRADQDAWALQSHVRALAAEEAGRFDDERLAVEVDGRRVAVDEGPRSDTSAEALAALRPAFARDGTVTAGNSSQTSDGAAAVLVTSAAFAAERGLVPLARLVSWAVTGVPPEIMGVGPVTAIPKALALAGVEVGQLDLVELNEAFAAPTLHVQRELGLDPERLNVNGGAIALGHPLGATGARLTATLLHELRRRQVRLGVVSMCVGGGMGAAAVFEALG